MAKSKFKYLGKNVRIFETAKIVKPEVVSIDDNSQIDDYTFISGGEVVIGKNVHIATMVSIIGSGKIIFEDHSCAAAGARFITSTADLEGYRGSACSPIDQRKPIKKTITIEKDAFVGTNAIVFPGVIIYEGAVIDMGAVVKNDCEPWTVYKGNPAMPVRKRKKHEFPQDEQSEVDV